MARNAEIFFEHDSWPRALGWSAGFHLAVTAFILLCIGVQIAWNGLVPLLESVVHPK